MTHLESPNNSLLLGLLSQPLGPFVCDVCNLEAILLSHSGSDLLERRRQVILEQPKL
jgi:hypothetical protein